MGGTLALHLAQQHNLLSEMIIINLALTILSYEYLTGKTSP